MLIRISKWTCFINLNVWDLVCSSKYSTFYHLGWLNSIRGELSTYLSTEYNFLHVANQNKHFLLNDGYMILIWNICLQIKKGKNCKQRAISKFLPQNKVESRANRDHGNTKGFIWSIITEDGLMLVWIYKCILQWTSYMYCILQTSSLYWSKVTCWTVLKRLLDYHNSVRSATYKYPAFILKLIIGGTCYYVTSFMVNIKLTIYAKTYNLLDYTVFIQELQC